MLKVSETEKNEGRVVTRLHSVFCILELTGLVLHVFIKIRLSHDNFDLYGYRTSDKHYTNMVTLRNKSIATKNV